MPLQTRLIKFHQRFTSNYWLIVFTAITRFLLAVGFIIPGLKKVRNIHFAAGVGPGPIREIFDAFFFATEYYIFVGILQVISGLLLLFPSTVALGSIIFVPIILNIFMITVSLQFTGTWLVSGLMLLAALFLLCWEFDKWQSILPGFKQPVQFQEDKNTGFFQTILIGSTVSLSGIGLLYSAMSFILPSTELWLPLILFLVASLLSGFFISRHRRAYKSQ